MADTICGVKMRCFYKGLFDWNDGLVDYDSDILVVTDKPEFVVVRKIDDDYVKINSILDSNVFSVDKIKPSEVMYSIGIPSLNIEDYLA